MHQWQGVPREGHGVKAALLTTWRQWQWQWQAERNAKGWEGRERGNERLQVASYTNVTTLRAPTCKPRKKRDTNLDLFLIHSQIFSALLWKSDHVVLKSCRGRIKEINKNYCGVQFQSGNNIKLSSLLKGVDRVKIKGGVPHSIPDKNIM